MPEKVGTPAGGCAQYVGGSQYGGWLQVENGPLMAAVVVTVSRTLLTNTVLVCGAAGKPTGGKFQVWCYSGNHLYGGLSVLMTGTPPGQAYRGLACAPVLNVTGGSGITIGPAALTSFRISCIMSSDYPLLYFASEDCVGSTLLLQSRMGC